MTRGGRAALAAATIACVASARRASAVTPPQITVGASATQVEVGEPFTVQLKATVEQGDPQPSSPELVAPRGLSVVGQSEGTQMMMYQSGNRTQVRVGLQVNWQIVADKPGRYTIPSPSVRWNGQRVSGTPVSIEVVPSTGQPRQRQQSGNPFLGQGGPGFGFSFPFGGGFGGGFAPQDEPEPRDSPELAMPTAPDPGYFLRATVDKKSAVVGQQITLSLYFYIRVTNVSSTSNHDAPLSDFLRIPLSQNPGADPVQHAMVGGNRYQVKLVDRMAIFPLRAGDLHTGQFRYDFREGRRMAARASEDNVIHVTEPPRAGRPVGYTIGDVGQFSLSADVRPRRIDQGGEVAVSLTVRGTGNLPQALRVPARTGIEWLDPERKESIEPQAGVVGGWRTLGYVVRIKESGAVDLGEVALPYWDPQGSRYQTAKASLGTIQVNPTLPALDPATRQPVDPPPPDPFVAMPSARVSLGTYALPRSRRLDGAMMWLAIAAPPLLVGAVSLGALAARRLATRRATAKDSPAALAQKALDDARAAEKAGDTKAFAASLERAVHLAIEGATGLKSRGVLLEDLPDELAARDLSGELGDAAAEALGACEAIRFEPSPDVGATKDLGARVRALVGELGRWDRKREPSLDPEASRA